jgi:ABC-type bacteriocin/lantibiotic exporter with double-glycine peptidase domain
MLLINQQLNIGQFIAAEIVIITVINSVEKLINNLDSVYDVLTSIEKVGQVTDKPVETSGSLLVKEGLKGYEVEMSNVGFSYNDLFPAISNISLQIQAGEKVCLMGGEGSGKSTILKLLTGTFSDFTGNIMINKIPINNYNKESLRAHTGVYLSQQDIFQGTLEENLTLGNDTIDRNDVLPLFEKVGLMNFLGSLKEGFDTELDPSGGKLAGSVVRKLLLVRSLVHQPCLILLEDPMSGMDESAREQIQQLLLDRSNPATVIVSSNDEAFARRCDKIVYVSPEGSQTIVNR